MIKNASILCVDDNKQNRMILEELVKGMDHTPFLAENGQEALEVLEKEKIDLILLDIIMPELDGYHTLEKIKESDKTKYLPVIMVSTVEEMDSIIRCIQLGADDYIPKPFEPEILKARIGNSLVKLESYKLEKELLEKTLTGSLKILMDILSTINVYTYGRSQRVRRIVSLMAKEMGLSNIWNLEIAALLSQVGCITVPNDILERVANSKNISPMERKIYKNHPLIGFNLLQKLPRLEKVATIIKYQNKNFDGTGVPDDDLKGTAIPMEAQILHIALDYDEINYQGINPFKTIEKLRETKINYNEKLLNILEKVVLAEKKKVIKSLTIKELNYGMIFMQDVITQSGTKVIGQGQEVSYAIITRLQNIHKTTPIKEPIQVIYTQDF